MGRNQGSTCDESIEYTKYRLGSLWEHGLGVGINKIAYEAYMRMKLGRYGINQSSL